MAWHGIEYPVRDRPPSPVMHRALEEAKRELESKAVEQG
jgi:hypothetical protein